MQISLDTVDETKLTYYFICSSHLPAISVVVDAVVAETIETNSPSFLGVSATPQGGRAMQC